MKRKLIVIVLCFLILLGFVQSEVQVCAKGPTFEAIQDVYYTKDGCKVYAEPTYESIVLTTLGANIPVQVIGKYSNGWYRINIGVIAYVKMDSLASAGAIGLPLAADKQIADAQKNAQEMGYQFVNLKLNKQKMINKDVFNSYVNQKVVLYVKLDDEIGISFKMLYADKVKHDINLNFAKAVTITPVGERKVDVLFVEDSTFTGQVVIFQFKEGYDKAVDINTFDLDEFEYVNMNTYYTEFSEFAYAPCTQIANMYIVEGEIENSLTAKQREKMANLRKGIKYMEYDTKEYRNSIHNKIRKDTEYVDYFY